MLTVMRPGRTYWRASLHPEKLIQRHSLIVLSIVLQKIPNLANHLIDMRTTGAVRPVRRDKILTPPHPNVDAHTRVKIVSFRVIILHEIDTPLGPGALAHLDPDLRVIAEFILKKGQKVLDCLVHSFVAA